MSATFPNLSRQLLSPTTSLPFNNFLSLAINTNIRHVHSQIEESAGSSGIPSKNRIKSPNPMALLVSPPLRKGVSCHQGTNNAYIFIPNEKFAHSDKSSGLYGPLSTSSQPSRNIYDYRSPSQTDMYISSELYSNTKSMFTRNFYKRIEDFLDAESLYMVDPGDYNRPDTRRMRRNMLPSMRLTQENSAGEEGSEMVRSACHSPKLISDSIMSSNLFQRRASHSQAPLKGLAIISEDSPVSRRKPSRLDIKMRSPIMEKDTPVSYRASSRGSMFNTPASVKGFVYFGSNQKMEKTLSEMKDCSSAELKDLNTSLKMMRGAQSVHGKISNGGYFKA